MRDPARIDRLLAKLGEIWREQPDLRLCQLIGNALRSNTDNYYVEDDQLEIALDEYPSRRREDEGD
jgi:hypothetical protein